ncbi:hypothetical protein Pmani_035045, partial [Petrolisthes manimaculis]
GVDEEARMEEEEEVLLLLNLHP